MDGMQTGGPGAMAGFMDAYKPAEIARRVEAAAEAKARQPVITLLALAVLAGAFIAFGAMVFTVTVTDSTLGYGPTRLLGGIAFSLGLVLVVVAGAELFTGNALIVMAWADGKVALPALLRNWVIVYAGNLIGSVATAFAVVMSGVMASGTAPGDTAIAIAEAKLALPPVEAFWRGVLCNALVCLAVWLSFGARSVGGKIAAIILPISAFVALGFEHSIANMYFIPLGMMLTDNADLQGFMLNLVPVTIGNIIGGGGGVALAYYLCYLRPTGKRP